MGFRENFEKLGEAVKRGYGGKPVDIVPKRFVKVLIESDGFRRDPKIWVYMSTGRDYIVVPRVFCSCESFLIEVIGGRRNYCKHLFFQQVCERSSSYREVSIREGDLYRVIREILELNMSITLRKIIYGGVKTRG